MGLVLFENREVSPKPQLDLKEAAALTQSLKLTKDQTRKMKSYLSSKGVFFPNKHKRLVRGSKEIASNYFPRT